MLTTSNKKLTETGNQIKLSDMYYSDKVSSNDFFMVIVLPLVLLFAITILLAQFLGWGLLVVPVLYLIFVFVNHKCEQPNVHEAIHGKQLKEKTISYLIESLILPGNSQFSLPIFKDFVVLLYWRTLDSHGAFSTFNEVKPYFSKSVEPEVPRSTNSIYTNIIIHSVEILGIGIHGSELYISVDIKSQFTKYSLGKALRLRGASQWIFRKKLTHKSVKPEDPSRFCCPHCGSAEFVRSLEICPKCGKHFNYSVDEWRVSYKQDSFRLDSNPIADYVNEITDIEPLPNAFNEDQVKALFSGSFDAAKFNSEVLTPLISYIYSHFHNGDFREVESQVFVILYQKLENIYKTINSLDLVWHCKNFKILFVDYINAMSDIYSDSMKIRIVFQARNYLLDSESNYVVKGSKRNRYYSVNLVFRRNKSQTQWMLLDMKR